jgi:hypothetical protein
MQANDNNTVNNISQQTRQLFQRLRSLLQNFAGVDDRSDSGWRQLGGDHETGQADSCRSAEAAGLPPGRGTSWGRLESRNGMRLASRAHQEGPARCHADQHVKKVKMCYQGR